LKEILEGLKITSLITLTEKEKEGNLEKNNKNKFFNTDRDKLLIESKVLAKSRIPRPPVKKFKKNSEIMRRFVF